MKATILFSVTMAFVSMFILFIVSNMMLKGDFVSFKANPQTERIKVPGLYESRNKTRYKNTETFVDFNDRNHDIDDTIFSNSALRAIIYVGPHKIGMTNLREVLKEVEEELQEDNYFVPQTKYSTLEKYFEFAKCYLPDSFELIDQVTCDETRQADGLEKARLDQNIIIFAELLSHPESNLEALRVYLSHWEDVIIVAQYRRYFEWLHTFYSEHAQRWDLKSKKWPTFNSSLYTWLKDGAMQYTTSLVQRFSNYFDNIYIMNRHDLKMDLAETFFCDAIPNAHNACEKVKKLKAPVKNDSVNLAYRELAYHANQNELMKSAGKDGFEATVTSIQKYHEENLGGSEEYLEWICPSSIALGIILSKSLVIERELFPAFFSSESGEVALRQNFERQSKRELCSLDVPGTMNMSEWQHFFKNSES